MTAPVPKQVLVELPYQPWPHQRAAHAMLQVARFLVLVWHRRAGKTVFSVLELLLAAAACTQERGRYAYLAPLLKQAKTVAWDYLKAFARLIPGTVVNETELSVTLVNGAQVRLHGADNPDALRGIYLDGVVVDELADMRPELWGEVLRPALADRRGWAIFIGTPKGVNLLSELYYRAARGEDAEWKADLQRAEDTGVIPEDELEAARREMSPAQYAQEFGCDFAAASEDVLVMLADVQAAQERTLRPDAYESMAKVLGVDVARYGGDRSVLFPRQGLVAFRPRILRGLDTMTVASQAAEMAEKWKADVVMVDTGGVGAGVFDRLVQLGVSVVPVDFGSRATDDTRFENKRAEMWWDMADWVRKGCLPDLEELRAELPSVKYTFKNKRGRIQLESKDDMRARGMPSPDVADALACTFAYPAQPAPLTRAKSAVGAASDYDPHDDRRA